MFRLTMLRYGHTDEKYVLTYHNLEFQSKILCRLGNFV